MALEYSPEYIPSIPEERYGENKTSDKGWKLFSRTRFCEWEAIFKHAFV